MTLRMAAAASAAMILAACADPPAVDGCTCDADCGPGSACFGGACVANGAPAADFEPPADAATHRLIRFTAATRDPEGGPVAARWSFRPVADGCDAEPEPAGGDFIDVVFWCAGRYEATLVPVDAVGLEGEPVVRAFDVAPSAGAPSVVAGPSLPAAHRCDLSVPRCAVLSAGGLEALPLEAAAADPDGDTLLFEWRALPPPTSEGDSTLRVTFLPDPAAPAPLVAVENGGGPIAGTWRFRVRAVDSGGLIGEAHVTVEVANSAPVAAPTAVSLPHRFEGGAYVAIGSAPLSVADPDGDALTISASLPDRPPSCAEEILSSGGGFGITIRCADPGDLIGPEPRTLRVQATDAHGAALEVAMPVLVENRPPEVRLLDDAGPPELDHAVGPCTVATAFACFFSEGSDPFVVVDPDGDPVTGYAFTVGVSPGLPAAGASTRLEGGQRRYRVEAPVAYPLQFRAADGSTGFSLSALAGDPWAESAASTPLRIRNRPPVVVELVSAPGSRHQYDPVVLRYQATVPGPRFADPDGDPLTFEASWISGSWSAWFGADGATTLRSELGWDWRATALPPLKTFLAAAVPTVLASDGWDAAPAKTFVTFLDRLPTLQIVEVGAACVCRIGSSCPSSAIGKVRVPIEVTYAEPDGDPALVTLDIHASIPLDVPPVGCRPGVCQPFLYAAEEDMLNLRDAFGTSDFIVVEATAATGAWTAIAPDFQDRLPAVGSFTDDCP